MFSLSLFLASVIHHLLNRIKKFLGNNWLVRSLINFAVEFENAVVKRIFQYSPDTGAGKNIAFVAVYFSIRQKLLYGFKRVFASSVKFKTFSDYRRFLFVGINCFCLVVIQIAKWSKPRPNPFSQFLAMSSFDVFRKVIYVILALTKGNVQHEFPLWCAIKPKCWKLQIQNLSCVQQINDFATIY